MRIAVLFHANQSRRGLKTQYLIASLAELWRSDGHEVRFLIGCQHEWPADVVIVHVDLSVVPQEYLSFASRYPLALNYRIADIRKTVISQNLVAIGSNYAGPVIVKTDLNSAGIPEYLLLSHSLWSRFGRRFFPRMRGSFELTKNYSVHPSLNSIPSEILARPGIVVEKFRPEIIDGLFFSRRCFVLGDRAISHRMAYQDATCSGPVVHFEWIENADDVLSVARSHGLDIGAVDYTVSQGETVVFDFNKTVGLPRFEKEVDSEVVINNYKHIISHLAQGIYGYDWA